MRTRRRSRDQPEFEITDAGVFDDDRYFDITAEYAKASPNDILILITAANRGPEAAELHLLPTLWFRNTWTWGCRLDDCWPEPAIRSTGPDAVAAGHASLGRFDLAAEKASDGTPCVWLFTCNETNLERLYGTANPRPFVKDAFHERVIRGRKEAVNPSSEGTKAAAWYDLKIPAGAEVTVRLRLSSEDEKPPQAFGSSFDEGMRERIREADAFCQELVPPTLNADERLVHRQASRDALEQAVLPLRGPVVARRRSERAAAACVAPASPQRGLAARLQPRRPFHA